MRVISTPVADFLSDNDPRLDPYRDLKDRELARMGGRFIVEGEQLVRRLLKSTFAVESILVTQRKATELQQWVEDRCPLLIASDDLIARTLGFKFHSGVMACALRPALPKLEEVLRIGAEAKTLLVCPEIANTENMGLLIRIAAGFGLSGMLLGPRCCDPFFRQSVRISMGAIFSMPIVRCENLIEDLQNLRARHGFELIATVLQDDAQSLATATRGQKLAILVGSEAQGLSVEEVALCDRRVTVPMRLGTDSLNVAISTGIVLYHFMDAAPWVG